jgi:Tol biopolymer transport system component
LICYRDGSVAALPFDAERLKVTGPPVSLLEGVGRAALYAPLLDLSSSGSLVFVPDDVRTRTHRLVWVNQAGNVQPLQAPERQVSFPALSPDGRLLAMTITNQQGSHIWIWDLQRDALGRVTYDRSNHAPIWSPDGQWVVFSSDQDGPEANLYRKRADGTGRTERLLSSVNHQDPGSFSPDGKLLAFAEFGGERKWDIWVLAMDGEHVARPFLQTQFNEMEPMISPDGKWLAYSSDESGRSEVYVQPFPEGGRKWQVSSEGANQPLWAPDGRRLFFRTPVSVMEIAIETQPEFRLGKQRVLFTGYFRGRGGYGHPNYDISRDGQRFLMLQPSLPEGEGATEINVILNWSEELKRLVRSQNRAGK